MATFFFYNIYCQEYNVNLKTFKTDKTIAIYAYNTTSITHKVTLFLTTEGFREHKGEISKMVKPKDSTLMVKLIRISNKESKMKTRYRFYPKPTERELEAKKDELALP